MLGRNRWWVPFLALGAAIGCQGEETARAADVPPTITVIASAYSDALHPLSVEGHDPAALALEDALQELVNGHRRNLGLPEMGLDPHLKNLARAHSQHMAWHEPGAFFDHVNPEGDGPEERAGKAGVDVSEGMGENIAGGLGSPESVFHLWLESPAHLAVLNDPRWTRFGVGYFSDPSSALGSYWTMDCAALVEE